MSGHFLELAPAIMKLQELRQELTVVRNGYTEGGKKWLETDRAIRKVEEVKDTLATIESNSRAVGPGDSGSATGDINMTLRRY